MKNSLQLSHVRSNSGPHAPLDQINKTLIAAVASALKVRQTSAARAQIDKGLILLMLVTY